jgi:pimeloyl-ACP methyl ester carboxylesterase
MTAMRGKIPGGYNFWFYEPSDTPATQTTTDSLPANAADTTTKLNQGKPLIIFLHGKSLSGSDLQLVRKYGTIPALEMGLRLDAYVIAPQTSNGWNSKKVWQMAEWAINKYPIDTNRIYVLGMSMGGYGTLNLAAAYPDKIAAAIALCGGATAKELCGLNKLPLWIIHGTADTQVPIRCSDRVVTAMTECGDTTRLRYDRLEGQNHSILARVFYMYEAYDWLFSHRLNDSARVVNREYEITIPKLGVAYKHLHGKKRQIKTINKVSGPSTTTTSTSTKVHIIKEGDTLFGLALKYKTTVSKLCQLNGISETSILSIGQKIKLP